MWSSSDVRRSAARSWLASSPQKPGSRRLVDSTPTFVSWLGRASVYASDDELRSTSVTTSRNGSLRSSFSASAISRKSRGA